MVETDKKREVIIDGAIKRFTHFGIHKTTMNEIAEDLSVSKPSLYYYFPDKSSLILGVIEKIFNDYFETLAKDLPSDAPLETTLINLTEIRHHLFQKYYMLHLSGGSPDASLNSEGLRKCVVEMKQKNLDFHAEIFQRAINNGEIEQHDTYKIAELYLESLAGLTSLCIMHGNKELFPDKKELKSMLEKQINLSKIFIKGLK